MRKAALFLFAIIVTLLSTTVHASEKDSRKTRVKGNTTYVTKQYNLKDFDKISISGLLNVEYTQKPGKPEATLYTSSNLLDLIIIEVKDGKLETSTKSGYEITEAKHTILRISSPTLSEIDVKGGSNFDIIGKMQQETLLVDISGAIELDAEEITISNNLDINIKGAAEFDIDKLSLQTLSLNVSGAGELDIKQLKANDVIANISGAAEVDLSGTAQKAKFTISGAGEIDAENLVVSEVEALSSGIGTVTCYAKDKIKAHKSGLGSIKYKGNPSVKDIGRGVKAVD